MLYKDACNGKSNQQNLGCIKAPICAPKLLSIPPQMRSLCATWRLLILRPSPYLVNAQQMVLRKVHMTSKTLYEVTKVVTKNLNSHRCQLLSSAGGTTPICATAPSVWEFRDLQMPSPRCAIHSTQRKPYSLTKIYLRRCTTRPSRHPGELAAQHGAYESYAGSPASKGLLQPDMWKDIQLSDRWDWAALLRQEVLSTIAEFSSYGTYAHCIHGTDYGQ